ncbi:MAG: hybrid sensor histidine kinase/response regulator, partial [Candidatus Symbiothrix sp.]|nr:hybrid sensor histidine kinase/response regulator [Candidatus Symbiothrix sp.]
MNRYNARTNTVVHYNEFRKLFFIEKDKDQTIFIISDSNSIFYYHAASASFKKLSVSGVIFSDIIRFFFDQNNVLWIITDQGYHFCYQVKKDKQTGDITLISQECPLLLRPQLKNCFYDDGVLYALTPENDLYAYDLQRHSEDLIYNLSEEIHIRGNISSIIGYHDSYFIGFKTDGVIVLEKSATGWQTETLDVNCGIFCLEKDRFQDLVWIGTDGQGVYIYSNSLYSMRSTVLNRMVEKMERPVRAIFLDHQNTLWLGSKGDGILKLYDYDFNQSTNRCKREALHAQNSVLQDNAVYCFAKSKKPVLWIGNEEGLCYYSYKTKKIVRLDIQIDGKTFRYIHDIWETANDELWIASVGLGIVKAQIEESGGQVRLTNPKHYTINNADFESNYFFSIYSENDSVFWFGNKGYGPFRYNALSDKLELVNFFNKYKNQTVNDVVAIARDRQGAYLFGTGYGLVKYCSDEDYEIFNSKNGLSGNSIHALLQGEGSDFWLSTNRGLAVFNTESNVFQIFDRADGLQVEEFSDGASFRDERNNVLFFGGVNGFLAVRKDETPIADYMPPITFERLRIFGNPYNLFEKMIEKKDETVLHLKSKENFFSLAFTAIDYLNSWNYTYYYRLSGVSEQWINNGSSNEAAFTNLSPGVYTLQVKYHNRVLDKESSVYSLVIKIAYPWYRSIYASFFYVLVAAAAIYFLIRHFRLRSLRRRQKLMHEIDKKRQKEVYEGKLRFFTNIAHEFCTPLTLISGPCERILAQKGIDPFVRNYVQMIQSNANRLNNLIRELIEFRKIETGNREPKIELLQVADLINEIENLFTNLSESTRVALEIVSNPKIEWNTDKGFLTTILINLVFNAFKYTVKDKKIRIETAVEDDRLLIRISNQSHSIREKDFKRIFDRYTILENLENREGKPAFSRNGLGLAISYNMVQLLKGDIRVENTPDEWVLF